MQLETVKQVEREDMRLAILQIIYADVSYSVQGLQTLVEALRSTGLNTPIEEVRRAVLYLQKKGLIVATGTTELYARLTAEGIDLCEGNYPCPAGISSLGEGR
jgi:hypothetical protein